MDKNDLLFEIGVEELPSKQITSLAHELAENFKKLLQEAHINFRAIQAFGSPRHLAILIHDLEAMQQDINIEKKGPAVKVAFNEQGAANPAALGFARSCGVEIDMLSKKTLNGGEFLVYEFTKSGIETVQLIPELCNTAIKQLSIKKPMRWGDFDFEFVRPIHWVTLIYGTKLIKAKLFGLDTQTNSYGHRFHHPQAIAIKHANNYEEVLQQVGKVIVDFSKRRDIIHDEIKEVAREINAIAIIDEELLDEVTGIVEWPNALLGTFDKELLKVPEEALISSMQTHQKSFPLMGTDGKLLPHFITVSNIKSKDTQKVIIGNERVMRARLKDAAFFYETDCKILLNERLEKLQSVIFQEKLGDTYERAKRIANLAKDIARTLNINETDAYQAGLLAKTDLVSDMVQEFPELQGIMGYYYATNEGLSENIAMGIRGQYMPRFSGDELPASDYGSAVSIADRLDKLIGIFGVGLKPTGVKDPFALRRAALGIINIIIKKGYSLDLNLLAKKAIENYQQTLSNKNVLDEVLIFINERLRFWYHEQGVNVSLFNAVNANKVEKPYDFHLRIKAVDAFLQLPQANALAAANKRVSNILAKEKSLKLNTAYKEELLLETAEIKLAKEISLKNEQLKNLIKDNEYTAILTNLADIQPVVDTFFDEVMVNVEDEALRVNRFTLLKQLRGLFLQVADVSKLQG